MSAVEDVFYPMNITGHLHESGGTGFAFPHANWPRLNEVMHATFRYGRIGFGMVYISEWISGAGENWPLAFGLTLSEKTFFDPDDATTIDFYLHEVNHQFYPYFGHDYYFGDNGEPLTTLAQGTSGRPTIDRLTEWAKHVKDDNGKSLWVCLQERAKTDAARIGALRGI